jgi:hypothetical protein
MQRLRQQGVVSQVAIEQALLICWEVPAIAKQLTALPASARMAEWEGMPATLAAPMAQPVRRQWHIKGDDPVTPPATVSPLLVGKAVCGDCQKLFAVDQYHKTICQSCRAVRNRSLTSEQRTGRKNPLVPTPDMVFARPEVQERYGFHRPRVRIGATS